MSEIMTIQGVECYEVDGTAYLKLEAVARGLGFTETAASGNECVKWSRVRKYLGDLGFIDTSVDGLKLPDFIPENVFYRLAMKAKNCVAEEFQAKIADEIIPAIRRTGGYLTPVAEGKLEQLLEDKLGKLLDAKLKGFQDLADRVTALEDAVTNPFGPTPSPALPAPPPEDPPPVIPGMAAKKRWMRTAGEKLDLMKARFNLSHNKVLHQVYLGIEKMFKLSLEEERLRIMEEYGLDECSTLTAIFYDPDLRDYFEDYIDYNLAPENRGW